MLPQPQVQPYSNASGLRNMMIAEKEVVLTFLLQLLSERGVLNRLAFKGGTCLRKMYIGIQFTIPDGSYLRDAGRPVVGRQSDLFP
jgi:predicted nucleotidyltransferase component of viral defense system